MIVRKETRDQRIRPNSIISISNLLRRRKIVASGPPPILKLIESALSKVERAAALHSPPYTGNLRRFWRSRDLNVLRRPLPTA